MSRMRILNVQSNKHTDAKSHCLDPVMAAYAAGKQKVVDIASSAGISPSTLTARAKRLGLPIRKRGRWTKELPSREQLKIIMLTEEMSYDQVGAQFGISRQRVQQLRKRWRGPKLSPHPAVLAPPRDPKPHVISFRLTNAEMEALQQCASSLSHDSANDTARAIVGCFLKMAKNGQP